MAHILLLGLGRPVTLFAARRLVLALRLKSFRRLTNTGECLSSALLWLIMKSLLLNIRLLRLLIRPMQTTGVLILVVCSIVRLQCARAPFLLHGELPTATNMLTRLLMSWVIGLLLR